MADPGLKFGPQWLRDTLHEDSSSKETGKNNLKQPQKQPEQQQHHSRQEDRSFAGSVATKLAAMKLAEFRYGREELLAFFDAALADEEDGGGGGREPPETLRRRGFENLWIRRAQTPINLQGQMGEEEQRAWQRGANSDTSMRTYRKEEVGGGAPPPPGGFRGGPPPPGGMLGGPRGRGGARGNRGGYDRHRSTVDDDDLGPGRGGRGKKLKLRYTVFGLYCESTNLFSN